MSRRGNIVVILLLTILLAASGLALLTHTGLHARVVAARREKRLAVAAGEQALILALHRYRERLAGGDMNAYADPESGFFNSASFPDRSENGWLCRHRFSRLLLRLEPGLRVVRILDHLRAEGSDGRQALAARAGVDLVSGDFPAGELGLLVSRPIEEPPASFLEEHGVGYAGSQLPLVGEYPVRWETQRLLCEALGLSVQVPDWRRIREKFSLEPGDAPIPRGIYLARSGSDVSAAFVEGDLQRLEFQAANGWQSIRFIQDGRASELRYRPGEASLTWSGDGDFAGALFGEKIIVHGSVWEIVQAGAAAFLQATRIELMASGCLVVRSGLESENLAGGRVKLPGLLLMAGGRDFFSGEAVAGEVILDLAGRSTVQAQVIAAGALVNGDADVEITGGVYARDIENAGRLTIGGEGGGFAFAGGVRLNGFKFLKNFRVHFIREGNDEE